MNAEASRQPLRKPVLRVLLGFLALTAVIAIIHVWTGIDENGRVLTSCFVISIASLLGLCGAAQLDHRPRAPIGLAALVLSTLAAALSLALIWVEVDLHMGRMLACLWLWALSSALHCLVSLAELPPAQRWMGDAAPLTLHAATALVTAMIYELLPDGELASYVLATLYILATLAGLAVLITHLMHRHAPVEASAAAGLNLVLVEGEIYEDPRSARRYRVVSLN